MSRGAALALYALLVLIWSSTWVAIKIGLEDSPALLADEPLRGGLLAGVALAICGLALAFAESLELGRGDRAALGAIAVVLSPLGAALGNIAIKRRGTALDAVALNGWGMLLGGSV